jgi:hypothetical protein
VVVVWGCGGISVQVKCQDEVWFLVQSALIQFALLRSHPGKTVERQFQNRGPSGQEGLTREVRGGCRGPLRQIIVEGKSMREIYG